MEKTKKSSVAKILDKDNKVFIIRAIAFVLLALVPAIYLFFRYDCYKFTTKLSFSGWGILALLIGVGVMFVVLKYLIYGKTWKYWKQVVKGVIQVLLPMGCIIGIVAISVNFLSELCTFLGIACACWFSAYLVNPFPEWAYQKSLGETADTLEYAFQRIKDKNE